MKIFCMSLEKKKKSRTESPGLMHLHRWLCAEASAPPTVNCQALQLTWNNTFCSKPLEVAEKLAPKWLSNILGTSPRVPITPGCSSQCIQAMIQRQLCSGKGCGRDVPDWLQSLGHTAVDIPPAESPPDSGAALGYPSWQWGYQYFPVLQQRMQLRGGLSFARCVCYNPKKLLLCYSFLLMVLILLPRGSFSLLPLPFRQKQPLPATKENLTFLEREEAGLPLL